uniref:Uncharacterized protein n=1 Tax=Setaria viridis TaxID=4556 RepID=A0A4U6UYL6_SETVI|nr:hypothetical protein SEVIR_4G144101v2 [Setaria viridis]
MHFWRHLPMFMYLLKFFFSYPISIPHAAKRSTIFTHFCRTK